MKKLEAISSYISKISFKVRLIIALIPFFGASISMGMYMLKMMFLIKRSKKYFRYFGAIFAFMLIISPIYSWIFRTIGESDVATLIAGYFVAFSFFMLEKIYLDKQIKSYEDALEKDGNLQR